MDIIKDLLCQPHKIISMNIIHIELFIGKISYASGMNLSLGKSIDRSTVQPNNVLALPGERGVKRIVYFCHLWFARPYITDRNKDHLP